MKSVLLELDEYLMDMQTKLARESYGLGGPHMDDASPNMIKLALLLDISSKVNKLCKNTEIFSVGPFPVMKTFYIKADDQFYGTYDTEEEANARATKLKEKHASVSVIPAAGEVLPDDRILVNKMVFWGRFSVKEGLLFCNSENAPFPDNEAYNDNLDQYQNPYALRGE